MLLALVRVCMCVCVCVSPVCVFRMPVLRVWALRMKVCCVCVYVCFGYVFLRMCVFCASVFVCVCVWRIIVLRVCPLCVFSVCALHTCVCIVFVCFACACLLRPNVPGNDRPTVTLGRSRFNFSTVSDDRFSTRWVDWRCLPMRARPPLRHAVSRCVTLCSIVCTVYVTLCDAI